MSDMTFGPQWLRDLSAGGPGVSGSTPSPIQTPTQTFYQFKLADHRYGREEMLALYSPDLPSPPSLKSLGPIAKDTAIQPMSFLPFSEEEQMSQVHGVNSNVVLKLVGRGPARGGRGGASTAPFKMGRPGRPREGSYQRGTSVDESEEQIDGFERKFYENERPSNFRTKGDASRSGRLSNWRTAQLEDGGGEVWRNSPMSPGPKSPDKWHVVGPRHGWKDHNDSREKPQQQGVRRGSERDRASDDPESGGFQHRIGGRWDKLSETEDGIDKSQLEGREETTNIEQTKWEVKDDGAGKKREDRDISPQAREMEISRGKREESPQIDEGKEKEREPVETTVSVAKTQTKVQRTVLNGGMNHGHVTHVEEQSQLAPQMPVKSGNTDSGSNSVTGVTAAPPRSEQMARLYAAGRGRGRGNTAPNRPQLPKVGSLPDMLNSQQINKNNAPSVPASVRPGRVNRQDEDKIVEGLEQSARNLVAGVVEDDDQELSSGSQRTPRLDHNHLSIRTVAMQQQQPQTFEVAKPPLSAVSLSHQPVLPNYNVHTAAAPHIAVPGGQPSLLPIHQQVSADLMNQWLYTDPQGDVQGPFTSDEMFDWMRTGYFRMELLVKRACDDEFRPLGEMIKLWGRVPFTQGKALPPLLKPGSSQWKPMEPLNLAQQQMLVQLQQQQPAISSQQQAQHLVQETRTPVDQQLMSSGGENAASSIWSGPSGDIWGLSVPLAGTGQSVWDSSTKTSELGVKDKGLHSTLQQGEEMKEVRQRQDELTKEKKLREAEERDRRIKEQERLQREEEQKRKREETLRHEEETRKQEEKRQKQEEERRKREEQQQMQERERKRQEAERQKKRQEEEIMKLQEEAHRQQQLGLQKQQEAARQKQEAAAAAHQRQMQQNEVLARLQQQQAEAQRKQQMQHMSRMPGWKAVQPSVSLVEIQQQEAEQERRVQLQQDHHQVQLQSQAGWSGNTQGSGAPSLAQIQQEQQVQEHTRPVQQRNPTADVGWSNPPLTGPNAWNYSAPSVPVAAGRGSGLIQPTRVPSSSQSFWDDLPTVDVVEPTIAPGGRGRGGGPLKPPQNMAVAEVERRVEIREEESVRKHFQSALTISDDLREWCEDKLAPFRRVVDTPTLIEFLQALDSVSEVNEYVEAYLGNSPASQEFARGFIERHTKRINKATVADVIKGHRSTVPPTDSYAAFPSLGDSGLSVKLSAAISNSPLTQPEQSKQDAAGGKGKRRKKRMQKVPAANFLSYSVNAGERPNKGELKSAYDAQ